MTKYNILNKEMTKFIQVGENEFNAIFQSVIEEGRQYFTEWASFMWDDETADEVIEEVFGVKRGQEEEYVTMFTYGILKWVHNIKREGGIDIVENATIRGHKMFTMDWSYPVTLQTGDENDIVYGTLFKVPMSTVKNYDRIEGYDPKSPADRNMYNREVVQVTTPNGEIIDANMYVCNPSWFSKYFNSNFAIPTGNFDDKHKFEKGKKRKNKYYR